MANIRITSAKKVYQHLNHVSSACINTVFHAQLFTSQKWPAMYVCSLSSFFIIVVFKVFCLYNIVFSFLEQQRIWKAHKYFTLSYARTMQVFCICIFSLCNLHLRIFSLYCLFFLEQRRIRKRCTYFILFFLSLHFLVV